MDNYEKIVEDACKQKIDKRFGNTSIEHARVLIKEIFLDANHTIRILTDSFNNYFYSKIINYIEGFLNKDPQNKLEIIIGNQEENPLLNQLKKQFPGQIEVIKVKKDIFPLDVDTNERVNFIVNDNNAYRYEYSDKNLDYGVVKAIANFNNKNEAKVLHDLFGTVKNLAQ